jgi:hypothetical protein
VIALKAADGKYTSSTMVMVFTCGFISMAGNMSEMRYWQAGKEKSLSLGVYPDISIKGARALRDNIREQLKSGLDCG